MVRLLYSYNSYVLQIADVARLSFGVELTARCWGTVFYSQLTSKVIHARSVQAVVYLECHVVSFECFVSLFTRNDRLYITPPIFQRFVRTEGILGKAWCCSLKMGIILHDMLLQYTKSTKEAPRS